MPASPTRTVPARPLVVTRDPDLLDDLLRLAAAGCAEVDVAADPIAARARWGPASFVVVGIDAAPACVRAGLPRRPGVMLAMSGRPDTADEAWQLAGDLGAAQVVSLPQAEPWLVDRFADLTGEPAPLARVVAVIGGRGGAGATVLAASLALTARRTGLRCMLVDADPLGGGIDLVLGWESLEGLRWAALAETTGRVSAPALREALPGDAELSVLTWERTGALGVPAEAMVTALDAGRRGNDIVVVDLPRRLDDAAVVALAAADRTLLVVPAELRACAAAARVAEAVRPHSSTLELVVRGPSPGRLKPREVARAIGLPLAGSLRPEPGLAGALERGGSPTRSARSPLADLCRQLLASLALPADLGSAA